MKLPTKDCCRSNQKEKENYCRQNRKSYQQPQEILGETLIHILLVFKARKIFSILILNLL